MCLSYKASRDGPGMALPCRHLLLRLWVGTCCCAFVPRLWVPSVRAREARVGDSALLVHSLPRVCKDQCDFWDHELFMQPDSSGYFPVSKKGSHFFSSFVRPHQPQRLCKIIHNVCAGPWPSCMHNVYRFPPGLPPAAAAALVTPSARM